MRILVFGDSITQGYFDSQGGWTERLRRLYDMRILNNLSGEWTELFNLGISGNTTKGLIDRFDNEVKARIWRDEPFTFVFAVGINDTARDEGVRERSNPDQYREELKQLIVQAKNYSKKFMFIGLSVIDEEIVKDRPNKPWEFSNNRIYEFEKVLSDVCNQENVPFVPIFEKFQAEQQKRNLLADGLHPNDAGHQLIYELVLPELEKLLAK